MERKLRISAGGIVIKDNRILLVRYGDISGKSYLVAPGGSVNSEEGLSQAAVRELKEETGLDIVPGKILCVEDLCFDIYRMTKVWFLCRVVGGRLERTQGAIDEKISEVKWYLKNEIRDEIVYPSIIMDYSWKSFSQKTWQTKYLEMTYADF